MKCKWIHRVKTGEGFVTTECGKSLSFYTPEFIFINEIKYCMFCGNKIELFEERPYPKGDKIVKVNMEKVKNEMQM